MTIKNKFTYHFTFIVGALLFLFSIIIYLLSANFLKKEFLNKFKEKVNLTSGFVIKNGSVDKDLVSAINKSIFNSILKEKIIIIDKAGSIQYTSFEKNGNPFEKNFIEAIIKNNEAFVIIDDTVRYGMIVQSNNEKLILASETKKDYYEDLLQLKIILFSSWLLTLGLIFLIGRYFAGKSLQPISQVVNEVDVISASNLHNRVVEGNGKDEIAQLARTFNRLLERLETSFHMQRDFVSNAAHELRTPLSSITAQLEVTLLNKRTLEEYELVLNSVLEDIRDLNQLSEGLFDLTLASRDVSLMRFGNVRMDELLLNARIELQKRKRDYKINIHFGKFPDDEKSLTLFGKEHLLKSVFINLMDNACKFSNNKAVDVFMTIESEKIKIIFSDKGIGMPASYQENIFKPLLRGENAKRIPGHGLGLALTKKIVELHHGEIQVYSKEGEGTSISIILPIV